MILQYIEWAFLIIVCRSIGKFIGHKRVKECYYFCAISTFITWTCPNVNILYMKCGMTDKMKVESSVQGI